MNSKIKIFFFCLFYLVISFHTFSQSHNYKDSIESYFKRYVNEHEVVKGKDKEYIKFFPIDEKYRITCHFERKINSPWFRMESSGPIKKNYRVYGVAHFVLNDTIATLNIYQSQDLMITDKYKDHLFIPFTDATSGEESYINGRYIDLRISDIKNDKLIIDFNFAYNPYCAYVSNLYNCPIPPKENDLPVAIRAGEKTFPKSH